MKRAELFILKNNIILHSYSSDKLSGIWKAALPFYKLPLNYNEELAIAIKNVLENSQEKISFDSEYSPAKILKETTKLKFSKLQATGVKNISLSQEEKKITFSPNKIIDNNRGFVPLNEKSVNIESSSTEDILRALKVVISYCC